MKKTTLGLGMAALLLMGFTGKGNNPSPDVLPSGQPVSERKAQESLPMASGTVWATLLQSKIAYSNKPPHITATFPPDIKAMNGRTITASGFVLPLDASDHTSHFLLSKRTPTCPFCPPGEPNEVIEVYCNTPIKFDDSMISVTGKFGLTNNTDNGVFFTMKQATAQAGPVAGALPPAAGSGAGGAKTLW
jgi:hypothetical protein